LPITSAANSWRARSTLRSLQVSLGAGLDVGELGLAQLGAVDHRQGIPDLHLLAQMGLDLDDPAGHGGADAGHALFVEVHLAGHPQGIGERVLPPK
jgi:hypothetical protein